MKGGQEGEGLAGPHFPRRPHSGLSYLPGPSELWPLLRPNNLAESFNILLERRFGKCHSFWMILQIDQAINKSKPKDTL